MTLELRCCGPEVEVGRTHRSAASQVWRNNPMCGPSMTVPAAKALLSRCHGAKQGSASATSFAAASTIGIVRAMGGLSVPGGQPMRPSRGSVVVDQRHVCDAAGCSRIEQGDTKLDKFLKCGRCLRVAYCSKEWYGTPASRRWPAHAPNRTHLSRSRRVARTF